MDLTEEYRTSIKDSNNKGKTEITLESTSRGRRRRKKSHHKKGTKKNSHHELNRVAAFALLCKSITTASNE
jgi:hypothetical protein